MTPNRLRYPCGHVVCGQFGERITQEQQRERLEAGAPCSICRLQARKQWHRRPPAEELTAAGVGGSETAPAGAGRGAPSGPDRLWIRLRHFKVWELRVRRALGHLREDAQRQRSEIPRPEMQRSEVPGQSGRTGAERLAAQRALKARIDRLLSVADLGDRGAVRGDGPSRHGPAEDAPEEEPVERAGNDRVSPF
jgi:hypothetical protein